MIIHIHRKEKKCFFRIDTDTVISITCQDVFTDAQNPVGGVRHICLPVMPPRGEGPSSPGHETLPTTGLSGHAMVIISKHQTCIILRKAHIMKGHFLTQNIIHCRQNKNQVSNWDFHVMRDRISLLSKFFHFPSSKETKNKEQMKFRLVFCED